MKSLVSPDGSFLTIPAEKWRRWEVDYPHIDLNLELKKANDWLTRNPSKRWKTTHGFQRWLDRAYERVKEDKKITTVPAEESKHPSLYAEKDRGIGEAIEIYASEEAVQASLLAARALLVEEGLPCTEEALPACTHVWSFSHYGHNQWCAECGIYADQLVDNFEYLIKVARSM